jgi:hypothetical protein
VTKQEFRNLKIGNYIRYESLINIDSISTNVILFEIVNKKDSNELVCVIVSEMGKRRNNKQFHFYMSQCNRMIKSSLKTRFQIIMQELNGN